MIISMFHYHSQVISLLEPSVTAPQIGFVPESYMVDEGAGVARLTIQTNMPERFTDATGALFYTEDGNATGGGGMHTSIYSAPSTHIS